MAKRVTKKPERELPPAPIAREELGILHKVTTDDIKKIGTFMTVIGGSLGAALLTVFHFWGQASNDTRAEKATVHVDSVAKTQVIHVDSIAKVQSDTIRIHYMAERKHNDSVTKAFQDTVLKLLHEHVH